MTDTTLWRGKVRKCSEVQVPGFSPVEWWEGVVYDSASPRPANDENGWPMNGIPVHAPGVDFRRVLDATNDEVGMRRGYFRHGEWIVQATDGCTCHGGTTVYGHEPGCGIEPIARLGVSS